jgi:hypothetical protein
VVTWQSESWQLGEAPFTRRQIEIGPDGIRAESLVRGETNELFDAETNTIYIASQKELAASAPLPKINVVSAARYRKLTQGSRGDAAFKVTKNGSYSVIATKEGAKRLREERARAQDSGAEGRSTSRSAPRSSRFSIPAAPRRPDASRSTGAMRSASSLPAGGRSTS